MGRFSRGEGVAVSASPPLPLPLLLPPSPGRNFPAGSGRCSWRDVQGLEVVPLVFHLGASTALNPRRPIRSFSSSMVCVSGCRCPSRGRMPGTVGSNAGRPRPSCRRGQRCLGRFERGLDLLLELVETLPGLRLVGLVDRAEALLGRFEPAALHPQELDPRSLQGRGVAGRLEGGPGIAAQLVKLGKEFRQSHGILKRETRGTSMTCEERTGANKGHHALRNLRDVPFVIS